MHASGARVAGFGNETDGLRIGDLIAGISMLLRARFRLALETRAQKFRLHLRIAQPIRVGNASDAVFAASRILLKDDLALRNC
jgi:hypothetical protein